MESSTHWQRCQIPALDYGPNHHLLSENHRVLGVDQWITFSEDIKGQHCNQQNGVGRAVHVADVYMTWSAAGFILGEKGNSVRDIVAVSGAEVSSRQGIWRHDGNPARWFQITSVELADVCRAIGIMIGAFQSFINFVDQKRRYVCIRARDFTSTIGGVDFTFRPPSKNGACTPFRPSCSLPPERPEILVGTHANSCKLSCINRERVKTAPKTAWPSEVFPTACGSSFTLQNSVRQEHLTDFAEIHLQGIQSPQKQSTYCQVSGSASQGFPHLVLNRPMHVRQGGQLAGDCQVFKTCKPLKDAKTLCSQLAIKENCFEGHLPDAKGGQKGVVDQSPSHKAGGKVKALRMQLRAAEMEADQPCEKMLSPVRKGQPLFLLSNIDLQDRAQGKNFAASAQPSIWSYDAVFKGSELNFRRTPGKKCPGPKGVKPETKENGRTFHSPLRSSTEVFTAVHGPFSPTILKTPCRRDRNIESELLAASAMAHFPNAAV